MKRSVQKEGKTLEEATESALSELGAKLEDVGVEVLDDGKTGFLGFGGRNAKVRVTLKTEVQDRKDVRESSVMVSENQEDTEYEQEDSEQQISKQADPEDAGDLERARDLLRGLIQEMQMDGVIESRFHEGRLILNIVGRDSNLLIGRKGQTLDSIQYLLNLMYSKESRKRGNLIVDIEEYKVRREKRLQMIAREVRDKVKNSKKPIAISPMSPQDRRIIHTTLQNDEFVKTVSRGEGLLRKVVVIPK